MSKLKQRNHEDYPEAASKNAVCARVLYDQGKHDGALYLAGYAVECTLKTVAQIEGYAPSRIRYEFGHDLNMLSQKALSLAALPSHKTAAYATVIATTLVYGVDFASGEWEETLRYHADGIVSQVKAEAAVLEAERLYTQVVFAMKTAGII